MDQTLPRSSSARPIRKNFPSAPTGTQLTTVAVVPIPAGSSSSATRYPGSKARRRRTPQPWGLTTSVWQCSEKWGGASRLLTRIGI